MEDLKVECVTYSNDFIVFEDGHVSIDEWPYRCGVNFNIEGAKKIRDWLTQWIEEQEKKEEVL